MNSELWSLADEFVLSSRQPRRARFHPPPEDRTAGEERGAKVGATGAVGGAGACFSAAGGTGACFNAVGGAGTSFSAAGGAGVCFNAAHPCQGCGSEFSLTALRVALSCAGSAPWGNLSWGSENPACRRSFLEPHQGLFEDDKAQILIFFMQNFHKSCYF